VRVEPFEFPQGSTLSPPEGRVEWVEGESPPEADPLTAEKGRAPSFPLDFSPNLPIFRR
jgi:hypothetical protein